MQIIYDRLLSSLPYIDCNSLLFWFKNKIRIGCELWLINERISSHILTIISSKTDYPFIHLSLHYRGIWDLFQFSILFLPEYRTIRPISVVVLFTGTTGDSLIWLDFRIGLASWQVPIISNMFGSSPPPHLVFASVAP